MQEITFKALETTGFVVVPGYLSSEEVRMLRADFDSRPIEGNRNYKLKAPSRDAMTRMEPRIQQTLRSVNAQTNLRVDTLQGGAYFATGKATGINFPWHQDHESFFELQNHYDYLNFYLPIVKPDRDKSNLSVVPFDALERESPRTYRKLVRGGAARFVRMGTKPLAVLDDRGAFLFLRRDMDRLAHTPTLAAGDLLLMRGDVIHRTQDTETDRVALSFRATNEATIVRRKRLAAGGLQKAMMMANNSAHYQRMFSAFDIARTDAMSSAELRRLMSTAEPGDAKDYRAFMTFLMKEKLRSGVMSQFVLSVSATYGLNFVGRGVNAYYRTRKRLGI